jgi:hypothetical protein
MNNSGTDNMDTLAPETYERLRTAVAAGAVLLDTHRPGWRDSVDISTLNMGSYSRCVLGQLYDGFGEGMRVLGVHGLTGSAPTVADFGFAAGGDWWLSADDYRQQLAAQYAALDSLWIAEVQRDK